MQYRLHIDIPLGTNEELAIQVAEYIMDIIKLQNFQNNVEEVTQINYRLGYDEDRQKSNYLNKTEEGHVTTKKIVID